MNEKSTCPICGQPTRMYMGNARKDKLCGKHADELKDGKIQQCPDCNSWHSTKDICECKKTKTTNEKCIICENSTDGGWQYLCSDCYNKCLDLTKEMNKNYTVYNHREYYYNLKSSIYRQTGFNKYIKPNCIKLIAIAKACDRYAHSEELLKMVKDDVIEIVKKKKDKDIIPETKEKEVINFNVQKNQGQIRGEDGHFLDSVKEREIDDILFNKNYPHAIHYPVPEINERTVICDWFIPITKEKGIYIEYFGMGDTDNNEEKKELYEKHKLKHIIIKPEETNDTQRLNHRLAQEIKNLKDQIYDEAKNI